METVDLRSCGKQVEAVASRESKSGFQPWRKRWLLQSLSASLPCVMKRGQLPADCEVVAAAVAGVE